MKRSRTTEFRVGLFVIIALVIGGSIAFVLGNQRAVFQPKIYYQAVFDTVGGLREGSPVRIAGVDVGTVSDVVLREDGKILVKLAVIEDAANLVREDSVASIGNKGLLGDRLVEVSAGVGEPVPPGSTIPSQSAFEMSEYLARAGKIMDEVEGTVGNLRRATEPLGEEQFSDDLRSTMRNLAEITRMAAEEDGTVRRLLTDPEMADDVEATVANTKVASAELAQTLRGVDAIVREVQSGDGTAHELIYGQEGQRLVTNLAEATGELATLMRDVREGDGMLHDVIYEQEGEALVDNLTAMSEDLRLIVADIRAGRGTVGGLLMDPSIYEDVKRLVGDLERNEILRSLVRYSIRRDESQGPIEVEVEGEVDGEVEAATE